MKSVLALLAVASVPFVSAGPLVKRMDADPTLPPGIQMPDPSTGVNVTVTDKLLLNWFYHTQLTEVSYYTTALSTYDEAAFEKAGLPNWTRGRIEQILSHEQQHAAALKAVLGSDASEEMCTYEWPYEEPFTFVVLSQILEGLNAGAYINALPYIQNKTYLPLLTNLIATESRHAWIGSAPAHLMPWSSAWETPATFGQYTTQLAVHTVTCPEGTNSFPFKTFQMLMAEPFCHGCIMPAGSKIQLYFNAVDNMPGPYYAAFMVGHNTTFVPLASGPLIAPASTNDTNVVRGVATIPPYVQGDVYIILTNSNTSVTDDTTLASAFLLQIPFTSSVANNAL